MTRNRSRGVPGGSTRTPRVVRASSPGPWDRPAEDHAAAPSVPGRLHPGRPRLCNQSDTRSIPKISDQAARGSEIVLRRNQKKFRYDRCLGKIASTHHWNVSAPTYGGDGHPGTEETAIEVDTGMSLVALAVLARPGRFRAVRRRPEARSSGPPRQVLVRIARAARTPARDTSPVLTGTALTPALPRRLALDLLLDPHQVGEVFGPSGGAFVRGEIDQAQHGDLAGSQTCGHTPRPRLLERHPINSGNDIDADRSHANLKHGLLVHQIVHRKPEQGCAEARSAASTRSALSRVGRTQISMSPVARGLPWAAMANAPTTMKSAPAAVRSDNISAKSGFIGESEEAPGVLGELPDHHHTLAGCARHQIVLGQLVAPQLLGHPPRAIHGPRIAERSVPRWRSAVKAVASHGDAHRASSYASDTG